VARVTHRLGRIAGIGTAEGPPLNPHELRHSFITLGLDAGASLRDMQRAAAHADPRTTADYDRRRKALDTHPSYLVERYLS
jgi:integrase